MKMKKPEGTFCPACHAEDVEIYYIDCNGEIIGCECCCGEYDAYQYEYEREQAAYEEAMEARAYEEREARYERMENHD